MSKSPAVENPLQKQNKDPPDNKRQDSYVRSEKCWSKLCGLDISMKIEKASSETTSPNFPFSIGPKEGYAEITFRNYGSTVDQNCGWVIFLLRGVDISNYKELRFLIRGEKGNEKIGIKAKDARGIEISLMLHGKYLRKEIITHDWQEAIVPLEDFGNVDFGLMDNFSLYTTGLTAGTTPQTIYVGGFQLK